MARNFLKKRKNNGKQNTSTTHHQQLLYYHLWCWARFGIITVLQYTICRWWYLFLLKAGNLRLFEPKPGETLELFTQCVVHQGKDHPTLHWRAFQIWQTKYHFLVAHGEVGLFTKTSFAFFLGGSKNFWWFGLILRIFWVDSPGERQTTDQKTTNLPLHQPLLLPAFVFPYLSHTQSKEFSESTSTSLVFLDGFLPRIFPDTDTQVLDKFPHQTQTNVSIPKTGAP